MVSYLVDVARGAKVTAVDPWCSAWVEEAGLQAPRRALLPPVGHAGQDAARLRLLGQKSCSPCLLGIGILSFERNTFGTYVFIDQNLLIKIYQK